MRYLAVDDEGFVLEELRSLLGEIHPGAEILTCARPKQALELAAAQAVDVAFLDIEMGSMSGLELALQLKEILPNIHIIFVTGYEQYAVQAFQIHATGYLLKPIVKEDLLRELTFLYGETITKRIRVQTFGGFDIFVDGVPLKFNRTKAKELLAILVDRRGASVTSAELYSILFEHEPNTAAKKTYLRNIIRSLKMTLEAAGAAEIIHRSFNFMAIVPEKIDCDYYRFLQGEPEAVNQYRNDYMPQYSWAEVRNAEFFRGDGAG